MTLRPSLGSPPSAPATEQTREAATEMRIEDLRAGDEAAWDEFFSRYDSAIRSITAWPKWRFDAHTREDLAQTVRAEIVRSVSNLSDESRLAGFVKRICVNRCIDEVRRQVRERSSRSSMFHRSPDGEWQEMDIQAGEDFNPFTAVALTERAAALKRLVAGLDSLCRTAIHDFYTRGLSYKQMAKKQGVAVNTVGSRLARCLDKLREMMTHEPDAEAL